MSLQLEVAFKFLRKRTNTMAKKKKADKRETSPTKGSRPPGIAIPIGRAPDITVKVPCFRPLVKGLVLTIS